MAALLFQAVNELNSPIGGMPLINRSENVFKISGPNSVDFAWRWPRSTVFLWNNYLCMSKITFIRNKISELTTYKMLWICVRLFCYIASSIWNSPYTYIFHRNHIQFSIQVLLIVLFPCSFAPFQSIKIRKIFDSFLLQLRIQFYNRIWKNIIWCE